MTAEITQEQIEALEFQANQAYETLKRAVSTKEFLDTFWAHNSYCSLNWSLKRATEIEKGEFLTSSLERGHPLERYILQYIMGFNLACSLRLRPPPRNETEAKLQEEIAKHEECLQAALEGTEHPDYGIENSYEGIFAEAEFIGTYAEADNFKKIFEIMEYIREKYPKPE